jgi:hypothetical protein
MEEIYRRQETLGINRDQTVLVVGCGGIGSWLGYFLALAGVRRLELFDGDKIEEHNLSRLPFTPRDIGRYKSECLAELITRARPEVEVTAHAHFDAEWHGQRNGVMDGADWVVVTTDSHKSRKMVFEAVKVLNTTYLTNPTKYLECGADGHSGSVTGAPAEWVTEAEAEPGYQSVPVFVAPCTWAASVAAYYILLSGSDTLLDSTYRVNWSDSNGVAIHRFYEEVAREQETQG